MGPRPRTCGGLDVPRAGGLDMGGGRALAPRGTELDAADELAAPRDLERSRAACDAVRRAMSCSMERPRACAIPTLGDSGAPGDVVGEEVGRTGGVVGRGDGGTCGGGTGGMVSGASGASGVLGRRIGEIRGDSAGEVVGEMVTAISPAFARAFASSSACGW